MLPYTILGHVAIDNTSQTFVMVSAAVKVSHLTTFTTSASVSNFVFTLSYISFLRLAISPSIITISLLTLAINLSPRT